MKLAVIGYGSRISSVIGNVIQQEPNCRIAAITDIRKDQMERDKLKLGLPEDVQFYDSAEQMMAEVKPDGVLIGTRCSLHTEMALKVLPTGIPLFLEKPVATTMEDWHRLQRGYETAKSPVVVSFPLRVTTLVETVREIVASGQIGTVEHVQAVNNVPYGGVYYHNWYRNEEETGGLFLQKATHDFDYINYVLGLAPVSVCAMTSKQIFKGDKPAGLRCVDCEENRTCEESTAFIPDRKDIWPFCSFAKDTGNEDSGSAIVRYESGMHVNYSQNFFARRKAAARGARFLGYKGTIEFDFFTGKIQTFMHHSPRVDTIEFSQGEGHFGGDEKLVRSFIGLMKGEGESVSTLKDGLVSALMCLKARESAQTNTFQDLQSYPI